MKICLNCKEPIDDSAHFCPVCGALCAAQATEQAAAVETLSSTLAGVAAQKSAAEAAPRIAAQTVSATASAQTVSATTAAQTATAAQNAAAATSVPSPSMNAFFAWLPFILSVLGVIIQWELNAYIGVAMAVYSAVLIVKSGMDRKDFKLWPLAAVMDGIGAILFIVYLAM